MKKLLFLIFLSIAGFCFSQTNSIVTELYLANNFTPKSGITIGSNNTLAMDCDQIRTRYLVNITGATSTGTRCPSQNQISNIPIDFYIVSDSYILGYSVGSTSFPNLYSYSNFVDICKGDDWAVALTSDGHTFKIVNGVASALDQIDGSGWLNIEYWGYFGYFMAINSSGVIAFIEEGGTEWEIAYDLPVSGTDCKLVVDGANCYAVTTWNIAKCDGEFAGIYNWSSFASFSQDYYYRNSSATKSSNSSYVLRVYGKYVNSNDYGIAGADISSTGGISSFGTTAHDKLTYSSFAELLPVLGVTARGTYSSTSGASDYLYLGGNSWSTSSLQVDAAESGVNILSVGSQSIYVSTNSGYTITKVIENSPLTYRAVCAGN